MNKRVGILGIAAVLIFALAILIFGYLKNDFNFLSSYISELGSKGAPNALLFNIFGFVVPGILLALFGWTYGVSINDKLTSILLSFFGFASAFSAIPIDSLAQDTPYSRAHVLAIYIALAAWMFALARIAGNPNTSQTNKKRAHWAATSLVLFIIGSALNLWPATITQRLVFGVIFGWTLLTSLSISNNHQI